MAKAKTRTTKIQTLRWLPDMDANDMALGQKCKSCVGAGPRKTTGLTNHDYPHGPAAEDRSSIPMQ